MINIRIVSVLMSVVCSSVNADVIQLYSAARLNSDATSIQLRDIADLQGAEAMQYGDLKIAELSSDRNVLDIRISTVRRILDDAGVHWGNIHLNGSRVIVRMPRRNGVGTLQAMSAASIDTAVKQKTNQRSENHWIEATQLVDQPTLAGAITDQFLMSYHVQSTSLRLLFESRDDVHLSRSMNDVRFEVDPASSPHSDLVVFRVREWANGRVSESYTISVRTNLLTPVARLRRDVLRHETIDTDSIERVEEWLSPMKRSTVCHFDDAPGRIATKKLAAQSMLRQSDVRRQTLIKRGDPATIRCLVGGIVVSLQAEAREDGGEGEVIEFRKRGERDTFPATITGPHNAVIDLSR